MNQEQIYSRKQYVEQVRHSFEDNTNPDKKRAERQNRSMDDDYLMESENASRGFFKLRFILSLVIFLAFLFIWQTGWSYQNINADMIQKKIETSIQLPDSFPELSDVVSILEK